MTSQTRRNWIVSIGQTAVGAGLAGKLFAEAGTLPAGLYGPSSDHLSHALMSADPFHPIPADCPTDYLRPPNGDFQPRFFTVSEFSVVRRLTELLVGDATPGLHQEIAEWIDLQVASSEGIRRAEDGLQPLHRSLAMAYYGSSRVGDTKDAGRVCRAGLSWLPADFLSLEAARQLSPIESISDEHRDPQSENPGTHLFDYLKAEMVRGLYTSKAGLKELDFKGNAFYARSPGCRAKG